MPQDPGADDEQWDATQLANGLALADYVTGHGESLDFLTPKW